MNRKLITLLFLPIFMLSCDNDDGNYTEIKGLERLVYLNIKDFRESEGLQGAFVFQFIMVEEAQLYSFKLSRGEPFGTQGLGDHWTIIHDKLGGYNDQALVLKTPSAGEDEIMQELRALPGADSILLEDLTQCGVGIESDQAGMNYVTVLLMKAD